MMKLFKPGGAISVFLVIILVPCLVVSFLFVDLSRVELSKAVAVSSADMALNSLMSHYDIDLNEYYGLVASCQTIDEFYEETEKYFSDSLSAAGLDEALTNDIVSLIRFGGANSSDLLQVAAIDDTLGIHAVENSGLGESPVLVKEGVVEFMKYRAPFELATSFLSILLDEGADNVTQQMEDSEDNSNLSDARNEFAEDEGELNKAEFYTFYYYNKYVDYKYINSNGQEVSAKPSKERLETLKSDIEDYRESYKQITQKSVESLWITDASSIGYISYGFNSTYDEETELMHYEKSYDSSDYESADTVKDSIMMTPIEEGGEVVDHDITYYINIGTIQSKTSDVSTLITELEGMLDDESLKKYADMDYGTGKNQYNKSQWYYFAYKAYKAKVNDILSKAEELIEETNKLSAMNDCVVRNSDKTDLPTDAERGEHSKAEAVIAEAHTLITNNFYTGTDDTAFRKLYNALRNQWDSVKNTYSADSVKIDNTGKYINTTLSEISTQLTLDKSIIDGYVNYLTTVIEGNYMLGVSSLEGIKGKISDYHSSFDGWKEQAYIKGSPDDDTIHGVNQYEIEHEYDDKSVAEVDWVTEFGNKLEATRTVYNDVVTAITGAKYGSKSIMDISTYSTFESQFDDEFTEPTEPMTNQAIEDEGTEIFGKLFVPLGDDIFTIPTDFNPTLERGEDTYYDFLLDKGYDISNLDGLNDKLAEKEGELEGFESRGGDTENPQDSAPAVDTTVGEDINIESGGDGTPFNLGGTVTAFASIITDLANMNGAGIRDAIYVTVYARNMFSFRTFEYEGLYDLASEDHDDIDYKTCKTAIYPNYNTDSGWKNTDPRFSDNKTLTNKMITTDYHAAYGAELEYILYGKTNDENFGCAYRDIYIIRLAMNTASGFVNFYSLTKNPESLTAQSINGTATLISGATQGIIPVPLVKCVLILMLAAIESVTDMNRLLAGLPVEIYKVTEDQWVNSLDGDEAASGPEKNVIADGLCLQYSDYLFIFLYSGFQNNNSDFYTRLGNVIQANMKKVTDDENYDLAKAKTLFKMSGKMEVTPLMMDMPLSSSYENGLLEAINWKQFDIEIIRGY